MDEISPIKFFKYYQKNINFKIIDIRDTRDFELYHIVDSINIPYSILIEKHHLFLNCNHTYFIICKNGNNSYHACKFLSRLGYHVINVIGGIDHFMGAVVTKYA